MSGTCGFPNCWGDYPHIHASTSTIPVPDAPHDPASCIAAYLDSDEAEKALAEALHLDSVRKDGCGPDSTGCRLRHLQYARAILAAWREGLAAQAAARPVLPAANQRIIGTIEGEK